IKGGMHLERASAVTCVAFDKTGTLTRGVPEVVDVVSLNGAPPGAILAPAASVEQRAVHPIALAIVDRASTLQLLSAPARDVVAMPGRGAEGQVDGVGVLVGNHRLVEERRLCTPALHARLLAAS